MLDGKKSIAYEIFYDAIDIVGEKMKDADKAPLDIWRKALENVTTSMKQNAEVSYTRMKRSKYERTELEEDPEERMRRIEEYQKVLENVARQQAEQSRRKWMIFPKIIAYFAFFYLLIYLLGLLVR
jgi:ribosomal protein S7